MIECIFTLDYEIYGNGEGSLRELVLEPAGKLKEIFRRWNVGFVPFIEAAELEVIEAEGSDPAIPLVKEQIRSFHLEGYDLGLHLHPQWYNARREDGRWRLDYSEYNLCTLPRHRIAEIVLRSLNYLRKVVEDPQFTPLSFRAGNWLLQPSAAAASALHGIGIRIDSSVFKGGVQHQHRLDYRRALRNGYYWTFSEDVEVPDPEGVLLEMPIYTRMVPFWKMLTPKRVELQRRGSGASGSRLYRLLDLLRFRHPIKLDFCRMTFEELTGMVDAVIAADQVDPSIFRPLVAIGHTKDLIDPETVESFLSFLQAKGIPVSSFRDVYNRYKR